MRIAIVSHDVITGDGQGRVNVELARHLLSVSAEVDIYADRIESTLLNQGAQWVPIHPRIDTPNLARVWDFRRIVDHHLQHRAHQYDVILACGVALSCPHTLNVAHFVHGTWLDSPYHPARRHAGPKAWYYMLYSRLNAHWEKEVWNRAQAVVAVSENVRRDIVDLGLSASKVHVIPNGVDVTEFRPGRPLRDRFGLPPSAPVALFTGDLRSPIKNVDSILEALQQTPSLHLALAGTLAGSPYPDYARRLGVDKRTHFLGYQTDIPDLMRSVDFLVLPSHQDAFGLVVTEAMASGLPVVVSNQVGAACLVDSSTGFIIDPPDDVPALTSAFRRLVESPLLRQEMGRAGRERSIDVSWSRMGERYVDLFRELIAPQPVVSLSLPGA
jgi:glycosyltransferase involved in cell wall biosynthesis